MPAGPAGSAGRAGATVHNDGVSPLISRPVPTRLRTVAALAAVGLALTACSDAEDSPEGSPSPAASQSESASESASPTESPTADVSVPEGVALTAQGTDLEFGDSAVVVFEPDQRRSSVLELSVTGAQRGRIQDFEDFILDDPYKRKAHYYYVDVTVENVGEENVGGAPVPLWGVNEENTLLPAVNFTTAFKPCASTPLPDKFGPGESVQTCLVYLAPEKGDLESVSFRPDQAFDPIEWTGEIEAAAKPKRNQGNGNNGGGGNGGGGNNNGGNGNGGGGGNGGGNDN
jgi:uncharacterized membrane protein YgcG